MCNSQQDINIDIVRIRALAIVCIVFHHSLITFHGWPDPEINYDLGTLYTSACFFTREVGLALFTFISGFLVNVNKPHCGAYLFLKKKAERLLIPAIFWGVAYHIAFPIYEFPFYPKGINGSHLWYLPMLFFCMVTIVPLSFRLKGRYIISVTIIISIILLRNTNRTFAEYITFFPIFVFGYWIRKISDAVIYRHTYFFVAISGLILSLVADYFMPISNVSMLNIFLPIVNNSLFYMSLSLCVYYTTRLIRGNVTSVTKNISDSSFTIYLLHQFVINAICLYFGHLILPGEWLWWVIAIFIVSLTTPLAVRRYWRMIGG